MKSITKHINLRSIVGCCLLALCSPALRAERIAPNASLGGVSWQVTSPHDGVSLRVSRPDGSFFEQNFASGESPNFTSPSGTLPDGSYTYELRVTPAISPELRSQLQTARADGQEANLPSGKVDSGFFRVENGAVIISQGTGTESREPSDLDSKPVTDDTFATNVTIQGQNTTLDFDDTSAATGFPARDWRIIANDTFDGGADKLSIFDVTGNTTPFTVRGAAPNDSLTVASNGFIGIGTIVPADDLHIVSSLPSLRLQSTGTPGQIWDVESNSAGFVVVNGTNFTTPFSIETNGNVGLGTTSPDGKLHVRGAGNQLSIFESSDNLAVQFRLQTNSTNRRFVALNAAGNQQSQLLFGDNGAFDFLGPTAADVRMRFLANGNVGIGTTAPDSRLTVNGTASKPGGGSWSVFSDERLKNIKGEFKGGLDEIMKLKPIRYEYKADNAIGLQSEGEHIGFGADAVGKVIPEAVTRNEAGYLMIDNDPILWTMLNAIKEQNAQIEDLKGQVKRLQTDAVLQAGAKKTSGKKVATGNR